MFLARCIHEKKSQAIRTKKKWWQRYQHLKWTDDAPHPLGDQAEEVLVLPSAIENSIRSLRQVTYQAHHMEETRSSE